MIFEIVNFLTNILIIYFIGSHIMKIYNFFNINKTPRSDNVVQKKHQITIPKFRKVKKKEVTIKDGVIKEKMN